MVLLAVQGFSQNSAEPYYSSVSFNVPNRFKLVDKQDNKVVFEDQKTESIVIIEKLGLNNFDDEMMLQMEADVNDYHSISKNVDVQETTDYFKLGTAHVVDWKSMTKDGTMVDRAHRSMLMQLNGVMYRFKIDYDMEDRKSIVNAVSKMLNTSIPLYTESVFEAGF